MIKNILSKIYTELKAHPMENDSLMGGNAGILLFNILYQKFANGTSEFLEKEIQRIAETSLLDNFPTFCMGYCGKNWLFKYLKKHEILDKDDVEIICCRDAELAKISLNMLKEGNFDFLHGGLGIAYYLLCDDTSTEGYFSEIFDILESLSKRSYNKKTIPSYDFDHLTIQPDKINLGLAHGITSILKFSIYCVKKRICLQKSKLLASSIANYLISNTNNSEYCFFSNFISPDSNEERSRLAWCYGDMSIAFILYQTGIILNDNRVTQFSVKVLQHTTKRKDTENTGILDAGVCHGTAGLAHIYNKLWYYTADIVFKESCEYWIKKTIDYSIYENGNIRYKKWIKDGSYETSYGLLEGTCGVGLVLLSYLTGNFDWDYCLMLND